MEMLQGYRKSQIHGPTNFEEQLLIERIIRRSVDNIKVYVNGKCRRAVDSIRLAQSRFHW
jgi:hypothetical protein